ncbi:endo-1,4-beta-xylanase [Flavobacteriaceae bacterium]|nr:endo-1,4-beta-xylanase [Flavobacteriaceae bacterium]
MKNTIIKLLFVFLFINCSSGSDESTVIDKDPDPDPDPNSGKITDSFKKIMSDEYNTDTFKFGATLNFYQFSSNVEDLFLKEFDYVVAENSFKQTIVHPEPDQWNWERVDAFLDFANKNNLQMRVHGPIGPQSSTWAKTDSRTNEELIKNYEEFLTELCKKINNENNVKWMDVVNETIDKNANWTIEKAGTGYQNPWTQIGENEDGIPLYIIRSFEIAKEHAPNISLVFNQHQGMQPVMWDKVKETILYLKNKGLRIDGLGWQAHLRDNVILSLNKEQFDYLLSLIDWAHENDLDFHITEIDYRMTGDPPNNSEYERQANGYANIAKALIAKRNNGVVTFNTWGVYDKNEVSDHEYKYIYDSNLNPKKAVDLLKSSLKNKDITPKFFDN